MLIEAEGNKGLYEFGGGGGALGEYFPKEVIQSVSERMHRT